MTYPCMQYFFQLSPEIRNRRVLKTEFVFANLMSITFWNQTQIPIVWVCAHIFSILISPQNERVLQQNPGWFKDSLCCKFTKMLSDP